MQKQCKNCQYYLLNATPRERIYLSRKDPLQMQILKGIHIQDTPTAVYKFGTEAQIQGSWEKDTKFKHAFYV